MSHIRKNHPYLFQWQLLSSRRPEDILSSSTLVERLISHFRLQVLRQFQESFDKVAVDDFIERCKVDLSLDTTTPEQLVATNGVAYLLLLFVEGHSNLSLLIWEHSSSKVLPHLFLEGGEKMVDGLREEEATEDASFLAG